MSLLPFSGPPAAGAIRSTAFVPKAVVGAPNGVNDDVQIQAGINKLTTGGMLVLQNGTYTVSAKITIPSIDNIAIVGQGSSTILKAATNLNDDMMFADVDTNGDLNYFELANMTFDGNGANQSAASGKAGVHLHNPSGTHKLLWDRLHHLQFNNFSATGQIGLNWNSSNTPEANYRSDVSYIWSDLCDTSINLVGWVYNNMSNVYINRPITYGINMSNFVSWTDFYGIHIDGRPNRTAIGINGGIAHASLVHCKVADCMINYALNTNEPLPLDLVGCKSFGANKQGFQLTATQLDHTINLIACSSASDGRNTGSAFAANDLDGFFLLGRGVIEMVACSQTTQNAFPNYGVRHNAYSTDFKVVTTNCDFRGAAISTFLNTSGGTQYTAKWFKNFGFATEGDTLSPTFAIDATGVKTVTTAHGLAITPALQDVNVSVVQNTAVDDWAYNLLKVVSVDSTNVVAKINVSTQSATGGAVANLAVKVGPA